MEWECNECGAINEVDDFEAEYVECCECGAECDTVEVFLQPVWDILDSEPTYEQLRDVEAVLFSAGRCNWGDEWQDVLESYKAIIADVDYSCFASESIQKIDVYEGTEELAQYAFESCVDVEEVYIPSSVKKIGSNAFEDCSISNVYYGGNEEQWLNIEFEDVLANPLSAGANLYMYGELVTSFEVPEVFEIKDYAFSNCESLKEITIPASVKIIGSEAFDSCSIEKVNYLGSLNEWAQISVIDELSMPIDMGTQFYVNGELVTKVELNAVSTVCKHVFSYNKNLETVILHDCVTSIEEGAFSNNPNLTHVILSKKLEKIGYNAFSYCKNLKSITIPKSVTQIDGYAFFDNKDLTVYCEAVVRPEGWHEDWASDVGKVVWNCGPSNSEKEYDDVLEQNCNKETKEEQPSEEFSFEEEYKEALKDLEGEQARYRAQNLCQYCGGTFRGRSVVYCSECGKTKDY
ncbi:MAG: leucine-rich repeat domain-containing protein [Clostridia bacterium]|nr:leucine-rich repeat domain-containing protein [Clostridia bacterium]